jgi:hypothetical protein
MRGLLNFIFANVVPIIVVVSIVLRIIGGMRNQARKKSQVPDAHTGRVEEQTDEEEDYAGVWDRLKPDEDPPPDLAYGRSSSRNSGGSFSGISGAGLSPPPVRAEIRPLLMPASSPSPRPGPAPPPLVSPPLSPPPVSSLPISPPLSPVSSLEPAVLRFETKEPEAETKRETPENRAPVPFFRRIENLSPLRRAVILAEILGPPRGA